MNTEQKKILNIYALTAGALVMGFIPSLGASLLALLMFGGAILAAMWIRKQVDADSLCANHMTYIIRTNAIVTFIAFLTTTAASIYVIMFDNPAPLQACADNIMAASAALDMTTLPALVQPCLDDFVAENRMVFLTGMLIAAIPVVIYLVYRLTKGLARATKGHRIGNVKSWL